MKISGREMKAFQQHIKSMLASLFIEILLIVKKEMKRN